MSQGSPAAPGAPAPGPIPIPAATPAPGLAPGPAPTERPAGAARPRERAAPLRQPGRAKARLHERLGFRLSFLLAVALLPLGLIGLVQAGAWRDAAREQAAAALMGDTLRAAAPTVGLIREAQGAAAAMAQAVVPVIDDREACVAAMTALNDASPQYSVAAFVPASGLMTCGSGGRSFDYRDTSLFRDMAAEGFPAKVHVQARGPVSGVSVVLVAHPVRAEAGAPPLGYVGLALPHTALGQAAKAAPAEAASPEPPGADYVTFNGDGAVLSTSRGFGNEEAILPAGVALAGLGSEGARSFSGLTEAGEERDYAVVPVVPGVFYALGTWPARRASALGHVAAATPVLFTTLMWTASLAVGWWAAERLVTRHMRGLSHAISAFAGGAREVDRLDMDRAPFEVREVAGAFQRMTDTILHDEAELEDGLREREALLREVHHRSKNNLQLIASIMNMQARRARSPEARALMHGLQERVMSLASVHRELYQTTGVAEVRADELLGDVARQIVNARFARGPAGGGAAGRGAGGAARRPGEARAGGDGAPRAPLLDADLASLRLAPDQAVPLALLLTEAMTSAMRRMGPEGGRLRVTLAPPDASDEAVLAVEAPLPAGEGGPGTGAAEGEAEGGDIGDQLLAAFAAQLGGRLEVGERDGAWRLALAFPPGGA